MLDYTISGILLWCIGCSIYVDVKGSTYTTTRYIALSGILMVTGIGLSLAFPSMDLNPNIDSVAHIVFIVGLIGSIVFRRAKFKNQQD